ncbi:FAD-dependent oxidoreductase [Mycobacterium lacus]|uniref:FAD-dependent oxidoreductase n=1 Tax=Mycobacterium lacus TaxID=169765 RepID=UPI001E5A6ABD|nr:FAD-dependent oxidoreductase [Mycobacterium lacus]
MSRKSCPTATTRCPHSSPTDCRSSSTRRSPQSCDETPPSPFGPATSPSRDPRRSSPDDITPVEVATSSWTIDPFALGSYSFHAPGPGLEDRRRLQEPISDRLYLAGEAVGVDNLATAHGALLSGRHAAAELMRRLG